MIIVEANLQSAISSSRDHSLCRIEIANIHTNAKGSRADYRVRLFSRSGALIRTAQVDNWPRNAKPAWRLIQAAMEALG